MHRKTMMLLLLAGTIAMPGFSGISAEPILLLSRRIDKEHKELVALHFGKDRTECNILLSSPHGFEATQLDKTSFLVATGAYGGEQKVYAVNPQTKKVTLLASTKKAGTAIKIGSRAHMRSLRSEPGRKKAMLLLDDPEAKHVALHELDLTTFELTHRHTISKKLLLADKRDGLGRFAIQKVRLSPDFKGLAFVALMPEVKDRLHQTLYALKVLDLDTRQVSTAAENIFVLLPMISSYSRGFPPFEWIDNETLLFQDIPRDKSNETALIKGVQQLKRVNVTTRKVSDCLKHKGHLALDGGRLQLNPVTGQIEYQNKWIVDPGQGRLTPKHRPFGEQRKNNKTAVMHNQTVLYQGPSHCLDLCVSLSQKHVAYRLRDHGKTGGPDHERVLVKVAGQDKPVKVAEAIGFYTKPFGWVEME